MPPKEKDAANKDNNVEDKKMSPSEKMSRSAGNNGGGKMARRPRSGSDSSTTSRSSDSSHGSDFVFGQNAAPILDGLPRWSPNRDMWIEGNNISGQNKRRRR